MFNIHARFKFCGYPGLKIVHSVLSKKIGKRSERRNCPFKIVSRVSEAFYKYLMLSLLCYYNNRRDG